VCNTHTHTHIALRLHNLGASTERTARVGGTRSLWMWWSAWRAPSTPLATCRSHRWALLCSPSFNLYDRCERVECVTGTFNATGNMSQSQVSSTVLSVLQFVWSLWVCGVHSMHFQRHRTHVTVTGELYCALCFSFCMIVVSVFRVRNRHL